MKRTLLVSTSVLSLLCSGAAYAQSTSDGTVETVVVTAERRTENLQTTAIAATVLSGADLVNKGIVNVDSLQFAVPNVTVNNFGQGLDFNIRGIGKGEHNSQTTTGVITYRDGVATFPGYFTEEPYYDIASLEVLRGPQGTFVGQNSTGGAVFVTTNNPNIDGGYNGYAQAQIGNYTDFGVQGAVNIPISDTFAARIAVDGETRDSFYSITGPGGSKYTGNKGDLRMGAMRISLLWKPNDQLTVLFKSDVDYLDMGAYPADPFTDRFRVFPGTDITNPNYTDLFHITANAPQLAIDQFTRNVLKVDYVLADGITLQSVSGVQYGNTAYRADLDGTSAPISVFYDTTDETIFSQEINIISPDTGPVTWVLGGYAQSNLYNFLPPYQFLIGAPAGNPLTEYRLQGKNPNLSYAGFGQINVEILPDVQAQFGARYTQTSSKNDVSVLQYGLLINDQQKTTASNFSYKGTLNWKINEDNFVYGFVATGFTPGGLNVPVGLGQPAPFKPETVTSYEVGWKANMFGEHVRTTLDGFYNDYKNFQVIVGYPAIPTFGFELNVPGTTKIYGVEADADLVFGGFSLDGGISLMHSELGQFYATDPRVVSVLPCNINTGPASVSCFNLKGNQQTYAPNFTFNIGAQYDFALDGGDKLTPRINFGHVSPQWATLFENPDMGDRLAERNILGAQLAWQTGTWITTLYATNLTDQHYVGALNSGLDFAGPPRQYGIRLLKAF
jgi:iron complex outermembrane recepter protein